MTCFRTPIAVFLIALGIPAAAMDGERGRSLGYSRPMADQDHAMRGRAQGQIKGLDELLPRAHRAAGRSEYIGVESNDRGMTYRFKFQRPDGRLVWVDMDGRSGSVLGVR